MTLFILYSSLFSALFLLLRILLWECSINFCLVRKDKEHGHPVLSFPPIHTYFENPNTNPGIYQFLKFRLSLSTGQKLQHGHSSNMSEVRDINPLVWWYLSTLCYVLCSPSLPLAPLLQINIYLYNDQMCPQGKIK